MPVQSPTDLSEKFWNDEADKTVFGLLEFRNFVT
jgi:hypothetical protein